MTAIVWRNRSARLLDRGLRRLLASPEWRDAADDDERVRLVLTVAAAAMETRAGRPLPTPAAVAQAYRDAERDAAIRAAAARGEPVAATARRHRVSTRTVQRIVRQD